MRKEMRHRVATPYFIKPAQLLQTSESGDAFTQVLFIDLITWSLAHAEGIPIASTP